MPTAHRIRRGLAIVPENRRLFGPMTVLQNLEMGAYLRPRADLKEEFERVYTLFPLLYERRSQLAGTLSGGEQQMVAMGRALMSKPRLLLMDEPSMGLAPILVERSFEIIEQVNDSGVAMLVVEQNANVSLSIADRGYVLSTGRIVLEGKAADLLEDEDLAEGVPWPLRWRRVGRRDPRRVPDPRDGDVPQRLLAGRALAPRARGVRGVSRRLGRARRGVGASGSSGTRRSGRRRRALLHARPDDVAVTTSVSQGVSALVSRFPSTRERNRIVISEYEFPTVGQIAHAQELRGAEVVHVRPDADGGDPARALRGGDRRADGARLLHDDLVPHGSPARRRRDRAARARRRRARARRQLPGLRRDRARRARPRRRRRHGRHRQVPARVGGPRVHVAPARASTRGSSRPRPAGSPTRTSSRCRSPTTRRTGARGASTPARRRCPSSTRGSPAPRSSRRSGWPRSRRTCAASPIA